MGGTHVAEQEALDLRDMFGLPDGGVSASHLQHPALQGVLIDHHGEEDAHLIIPEEDTHKHTHGSDQGGIPSKSLTKAA